MPKTTDEHSPINKTLGIQERFRYAEVTRGNSVECLRCQERSEFLEDNPDAAAVISTWQQEHTQNEHGGDPTWYFVWSVGRLLVKV
jgi:hypothetical protein